MKSSILSFAILLALTLCADAQSASLTDDEIAAMQVRIAVNWVPLFGRPQFKVEIRLNRDGTLSAPPRLLALFPDEALKRDFERAAAAIVKGQPYTMLRQESYDRWKQIELVMNQPSAEPTPPAPRDRPRFDPEKVKAYLERKMRERSQAQ